MYFGHSRLPSFGMLRRVALVRTDVSAERIASVMASISGELGTTLAVTSNRRTLVFLCSVLRLLVTVKVPSSPIPVTLMMEAIRSSETSGLTGATRRNIPYLSASCSICGMLVELHP
jgi:hypothetical protein